MRNLSLSAISITPLQNSHYVSAIAVDLDANVLYVASERQNLDADVEVEISKFDIGSDVDHSVLATLTTTAFPTPHSSSQVVSFRVLPETRCIASIMRGGDITTVSLDDEDPIVVVEGTVEPGILAASWSPDDSLLVLVTAEDKLILMTSTFDVLSETLLHTLDFGEAEPINVGWGSKQTQFHGSLGKAAATQSPGSSLATIGSSPDDNAQPWISWRGDASSFVVSSLSPVLPDSHHDSSAGSFRHRILRVYSRLGSLLSTAEAVAGLEHSVAWRPRGDLIAGTQRFGDRGLGQGRQGRHDVVFFEKNGLRHGEFGLRDTVSRQVKLRSGNGDVKGWGYKVRELSWSSDSNVLGVWIERNEGDVVQLWTTGNYHWYLKQEIHAPQYPGDDQQGGSGRFTSVNWHPEIALRLILTTRLQVIQRTYAWDTYASPNLASNDTACVAVLDGSSILLTPFRTQNVPPPMSSYQLPLAPLPVDQCTIATPIHVSFSPSHDMLAVLWESGHVELWILRTRLGPARGKVMEPLKMWTAWTVVGGRQVTVWTKGDDSKLFAHVVVLGSTDDGDVLFVVDVNLGNGTAEHAEHNLVSMPRRNGRLFGSVEGDHTTAWQSPDGDVFEVNTQENTVSPVTRFPEFCFSSQRISLSPKSPGKSIYVGLADSGKLYIAALSAISQTMSSNTTSFTIASNFLIFTTNAHEAAFAPVASLAAMLTANENSDGEKPEWEKRRVERGSRIVTAVPSTMSLVLQMPRGNLETINPRPLVMEVVKQDLDAGNYRKAFFACRKHRIDLNVLVDHNRTMFFERVTSFVEQVDEVDYINLFLTSLGQGSQPPDIITRVCDALRVELEKKALVKYVNCILTAYMVKTPPDHEAGLALLLQLRESDPLIVEDAVKYMIFLVDAERLFDTALGMYDFSLVLMIAQHAQKDPREYLPFLRELRALEKFYQRFRIDDHLGRYERALRNLNLAGSDRFDEAMTYVERHQLYEHALSIWKGTDQYPSVLNIYGNWLFDRREFKQAAAVFIAAKRLAKAMLAHEKGLQWQELFDLALRQQLPADEIVSLGYRVAEDLLSKKRYSESARVLLDYSKDVREAVIALVRGNDFSEARRIATLHSAPELLTDIIYPGTLESSAQLGEDINEMREQLQKQVNRIRELRVKKVQEPDTFYGTDDVNLHNVDVMTDVSMPATAFTRYTVAPTAMSKLSKRSSRSKRKMERKAGSGRKGTVDEEEYLLRSVTKLVGRFNATQSEAANVLPHLCQFTAEHHAEGATLQDHLDQLQQELKEALEVIWEKPADAESENVSRDSWTTRTEKEREREVNQMVKLTKPELVGQDWRMTLLEVLEAPS